MKSRPLLVQVLTVNLLLVAGTVMVATVAVDTHASRAIGGNEALVLTLAMIATLLGNWLLLRRRFEPLERMIRVVESERRESGRAVIEAQERERHRIAQDLHDEVNQALTAISLRLQASIEHAPPPLQRELLETKRLSGQAMQELLSVARQLRPTVLDDRGLVPALRSQVQDFADRTGLHASFRLRGTMPRLSAEQQLVIYRVTQESLSNALQHSGARSVEVELSFVGRTLLRVHDDGRGFENHPRGDGLGLSGMRERALLVGGRLSVLSGSGRGTRVELTI
ncbi:MAG: sensor histidine kinase [Actinomycetota bacterium]|nr:sensor histidine kinase [Actinomycetota bacterium]